MRVSRTVSLHRYCINTFIYYSISPTIVRITRTAYTLKWWFKFSLTNLRYGKCKGEFGKEPCLQGLVLVVFLMGWGAKGETLLRCICPGLGATTEINSAHPCDLWGPTFNYPVMSHWKGGYVGICSADVFWMWWINPRLVVLKPYGCDVCVFHVAISGEVKLFAMFRQILSLWCGVH